MKAYKKISRLVRAACNLSGTAYPLSFVEGEQAPRKEGTSYHYETRGGKRIDHPSAYGKRGWSNMVYCPSTVVIVVGRRWVQDRLYREARQYFGWLDGQAKRLARRRNMETSPSLQERLRAYKEKKRSKCPEEDQWEETFQELLRGGIPGIARFDTEGGFSLN